MSKKLLLLILIFITFQSKAQYTFERNYYLDGYYRYNISPGAINTIDSGYYLVSYSGDTNATQNFFMSVARFGKNGNIIWNKNSDFFNSQYNAGYGLGQIVQYPDSSLLILWNDQDWATYRTGYIHLDKNGNTIWGKKYLPPTNWGYVYMNSLSQASDAGVVGWGTIANISNGLTYTFLLKTDSAGNIQWCKQYYPDSADYGSGAYNSRVGLTPDSGFLLTFSAIDTLSFNGYGYLMKTDKNGNFQWAKTYNQTRDIPVFTKPQIANNCIFLALIDTSYSSIAVLKTNMQGIPIWNYAYTSPDMNFCYDGVTDENGNTILSGLTSDTVGFIFKIDSSGGILWSYKYGKPDSSDITNLLLTQDGGILGYSWGPLLYNTYPTQSLFDFIKTDAWGSDGCEQPFPITKTALPLVYSGAHVKAYPVAMTQLDTILNFHDVPMDTTTLCALRNTASVNTIKANTNLEVYPNPSTGIFTIAFIGAQNFVPATIEIYNVLGQKVFIETTPTLLPQSGGGASVSYPINISSCSNGVYFYRVVSESGNLLGEGKVVVER